MIFSHSRLKTYENCPRKFAFQYIEKPDIARRDSIEAYMGTMVHDTLENLYRSVMMERVPKWQETLTFYEDHWAKNWKDDILIVRKEYTADDYRNVGRRCLQDYFTRHFPFAQGKVLSLEERILVDLDGTGNYKLQGFIDRLSEADDGTIEIHDYKTSRRLPSQEEVNRERQLALYQIGIEERWPDVPRVRLMWHYLRSGRIMVSMRSRDSLDELKAETVRLIDRIAEAREKHEFPARETMLCDWCEFSTICPAKQHLIATAAMTPAEFSADDGVRLADRFVDAREAVRQSKENLDFARDQIVAFSKQKNLLRLQGHSHSVRVSIRQERVIPNATDPNRKILEAVVRASGQWDKVSDISRSKLPKALQGDLFDPVTKQRVNELLVERTTETVTTSKTVRDDLDDGPDA